MRDPRYLESDFVSDVRQGSRLGRTLINIPIHSSSAESCGEVVEIERTNGSVVILLWNSVGLRENCTEEVVAGGADLDDKTKDRKSTICRNRGLVLMNSEIVNLKDECLTRSLVDKVHLKRIVLFLNSVLAGSVEMELAQGIGGSPESQASVDALSQDLDSGSQILEGCG